MQGRLTTVWLGQPNSSARHTAISGCEGIGQCLSSRLEIRSLILHVCIHLADQAVVFECWKNILGHLFTRCAFLAMYNSNVTHLIRLGIVDVCDVQRQHIFT